MKKVFVYGFWSGFLEKTNPMHVDFFIKLLNDIYNEEIIITNNLDDADIFLSSVFKSANDNYFINYKKWEATFFYTGEAYYNDNNLSSYTCVLGYSPTNDNFIEFPPYIKYFKLYYPDMWFEPTKCINNNMLLEPTKCIKNNLVSAVIGNDGALDRRLFLDKLEKKMNVLYGGRYKNNIGGPIMPFCAGYSENLINFYKNTKFVITMENTKIEHYITEKLINGFRAGIVPIYWGSPHISKHFNTKRFIVLEDTSESSIDAVIDRMINMSDEEYFRMVNEPIFNEGMNIDIIYNNAVENIKKLVFKK
jgi:hypothetical protein